MENRVKEYVEECERNSVSNLKKMCKDNNVKGYSSFTKHDLARSCCAPSLIRDQINSDPKIVQIKGDALDSIRHLILAGGNSCINVMQEQIDFLNYTVERPLKVYRGISLIWKNLNAEQRDTVNALKLGDMLPEFLYKSSMYNNCYASFSKKKSIANWYSREGNVSIVVEKTVQPENVLVDLENLHKIAPDSELVEYHSAYFESDKEVIIVEPVEGLTIIKKEGRF